LSLSHFIGGSASACQSLNARESSFDVSSVFARSEQALFSNQLDGSVSQSDSARLSISGPTDSSALFSESDVSGKYSDAVATIIARSGIAPLSTHPDSSIVQRISAKVPISDSAWDSASFSDSDFAHGSFVGVSSVIARSAGAGDLSVVEPSLSFLGSPLTGLTSIARIDIQGSSSVPLRNPVYDDPDVWPAADGAGDAQQKGELSAGKITGGVVGSLAAALCIAGGLVFLLLFRRKRQAPEPSCHETTVENVSADPSDGVSECLSHGCGSFDEFTDEAFCVAGGAPNWMDNDEN
jgi:hypothetical protein